MDPKSSVVKSKSSNGGVSNRREKQKSTKSDAEFQPLSMKKRGVYVENKDNKLINIYENNDAELKKKPPPRPRPGQKKFLTSVLTILSKSTTGTQHPDLTYKSKKKTYMQKKRYQQSDETHTDFNEKLKTKKLKYKSKILNGDCYQINDKFVVLQPRKDIVHTPSNFSENTPINDSNNPLKELLENNIYSGVAEGLAKEILENSENTLKNRDDPSTLVADPTNNDKKLYKFFVDLLETTFDVYNVETEPAKSKDTILEMDETVAKRLNFHNDTPIKEEVHALNFKIQEDKMYESEYTMDKPKYKKKVSKRFVHSRSFVRKLLPKSNSVVMKKKPQSKKSKKHELLNTIKEELKSDIMTFEEPQNLFQALSNMAKYKRKCLEKKSIHFEENDNPLNDCKFGRDLFSDKTYRKRKNRKERVNCEKQSPVAKITKIKREPVINISNHSLKVYGIEYENSFDGGKYFSSSTNITDVDFNGAFGISNTSLDVKGFYSLLRE